MLNVVTIALLIVFSLLGFRFWLGNDSVLEVVKLKKTIAAQRNENAHLQQRNQEILMHINNLKSSPLAIEEQARYELGMIRRGEKFYQIVEPIE